MLQFICTILTKQPWFTKIYKDAWIIIGLSGLLSYLWYTSPTFQPPRQPFFFYFFFSFFLKKKRATKSPTSFPRPVRVRWRSPPLCTSLLYAHTALPLSLFLAADWITLPHTYTQPLTQTYRTKNRNLKRIQTEQNESPPESSAAQKFTASESWSSL